MSTSAEPAQKSYVKSQRSDSWSVIKATRSAYREAVFLEFVHLEGMSFLICAKAEYVLKKQKQKQTKKQASTNINMIFKYTSTYPLCLHFPNPSSQQGLYIVKQSYIFAAKFGLYYTESSELSYQQSLCSYLTYASYYARPC